MSVNPECPECGSFDINRGVPCESCKGTGWQGYFGDCEFCDEGVDISRGVFPTLNHCRFCEHMWGPALEPGPAHAEGPFKEGKS